MAAFTSGTVESKMRLGRKDDMDDTHAPLMAAQTRPRTKKSWYRQPRVHVAVGVGVLAVGGFYLLFAAHGGDREARGTKHFVPWGRAAPERIRNHFGELARARARLERAVRSPISASSISKAATTTEATKAAAQGKLAHKQVSKGSAKHAEKGTTSFNKWLDAHHKPTHTLEAALHRFEKKEGYKRGQHSLKGGEYKSPDHNWGQEYGKFLAKTHPVGHTLHDAGVHPDTYHPGTTAPSKVCLYLPQHAHTPRMVPWSVLCMCCKGSRYAGEGPRKRIAGWGGTAAPEALRHVAAHEKIGGQGLMSSGAVWGAAFCGSARRCAMPLSAGT